MCKALPCLQMVKSTRTPAPAPQPDPTVAGPAAVEEADLLAASVARVEHRLRLLDELAEMATKLARDVTEQGLAAKPPPPTRPCAPCTRANPRQASAISPKSAIIPACGKENSDKSNSYVSDTLEPPT